MTKQYILETLEPSYGFRYIGDGSNAKNYNQNNKHQHTDSIWVAYRFNTLQEVEEFINITGLICILITVIN